MVDDVANIFINGAGEEALVSQSELSLVDLFIGDIVTETAASVADNRIDEGASGDVKGGQNLFSLVADTLTSLLASSWESSRASIGVGWAEFSAWSAHARWASVASGGWASLGEWALLFGWSA